MLGQKPECDVSAAPNTSAISAETIAASPAYRRPQLEFIGKVTRLVQSGPVGNRYETYQGSYWSDR